MRIRLVLSNLPLATAMALAVVVVLMGPPGGVTGDDTAEVVSAADTADNNACVAQATATVEGAWTCMGDTLNWNAGTERDPHWKSKQVTGADAQAPTVELEPSGYGGGDDTWCEYLSKCAAVGSPSADGNIYNAKVKGNAVFGWNTDPLGSFDVIWRVFMVGPRAAWRLHLVWDWGQAVNSDFWSAWEREENTLSPDGSFCFADFSPATISKADQSAWSPGPDTRRGCSDWKDKQETWHDDLDGRFFSGGTAYGAHMLHTAHWKSWKKSNTCGGCKDDWTAAILKAWDY